MKYAMEVIVPVKAKSKRALRLSRTWIRRSRRSLRKKAQRGRVTAHLYLFRARHTYAMQVIAVVKAKSKRALRLSRISICHSRRSLRKKTHRGRVTAHLYLFRARHTAEGIGRATFMHADRWSATIVSLLIVVLFVVFAEASTLKASEVSLTCAQVIGAALALILSLSIIPAQRAAEAFSPAVLKLYAKDHWLLIAFLILAFTTAASVLLGTNFVPDMDSRISIGLQFLLLGISFDAIRIFHGRTLDLLVPQTAIQIVVRQCTKLLNSVSRFVDRLTRIQTLAFGDMPNDASRALLFSASSVSGALRSWIAQLDEIAHKLIAGRDTTATNQIITAMANIGTQYSEVRRNSLILLPDFDNLFAGGVSDIAEVLNPIYESIRVICEDASKASNGLVVKHGIQSLATMTTHAMTMVHSANGWKRAPLAFSGCFWLGRCSTIAVQANMGDAVLAAVTGLQNVLLAQKGDVPTPELEAQALESLHALAFASYFQSDGVWGFPALKAMLLAARHNIELHGYQDNSTLDKVLEYARELAPLEVAMEKAKKRTLQVFPPHDFSFEASLPALFEMVARRVSPDTEHRLINPFHEFLEASEAVRNHYRELSKTNFENTLAQKWVVSSLIKAARVHWCLILEPPAGTEDHIDDVEEALCWLISWLPAFFPEQNQPPKHHLVEAADSLACLGISLLENDRVQSARACAFAIAGLVTNVAAQHPQPYVIADLHQRLEILARAADTLGKSPEAVALRAMIQRPASIAESQWPHYLDARQNSIRHLDRKLQERQDPLYAAIRDDPVFELQRILNRGTA
jgi:hypothetical protein